MAIGLVQLNEIATEAILGRKSPLAVLGGDVQGNPDNYDHDGRFIDNQAPKPTEVPVWKGCKIYLTQNVQKQNDYVNGMECTVENYYAHQNMIRVKTKTGKRLAITQWTDRDRGFVRYFPIRLAYASNVHRVQGDEFKHVTIWPDSKLMPAAGYTALSRVSTRSSYLLGGRVERDHFLPAC